MVELENAPIEKQDQVTGVDEFTISLSSWLKNCPDQLPTPVIGWQKWQNTVKLVVGVVDERLIQKQEWVEILKKQIQENYGILIEL